MIFALPEYDIAFAGFVHDSTRDLARVRSPILSLVEWETHSASVSSRVRDRAGMDVDLPGRSTQYEVAYATDAVRAGDAEPLIVELDGAAENVARNLVQMVLEHVSAITSATGNVVSSPGGLTFDAYYEMLDTMEWHLDDDGNLSEPTLVLHPDAVKDLPEETPEQVAMIAELKRRKYEEALARRRRRRLS